MLYYLFFYRTFVRKKVLLMMCQANLCLKILFLIYRQNPETFLCKKKIYYNILTFIFKLPKSCLAAFTIQLSRVFFFIIEKYSSERVALGDVRSCVIFFGSIKISFPLKVEFACVKKCPFKLNTQKLATNLLLY